MTAIAFRWSSRLRAISETKRTWGRIVNSAHVAELRAERARLALVFEEADRLRREVA